MSNASRSAELRARLEALKVNKLSFSTLGHASYTWLNETKAVSPFTTPAAASQMFGILSKGETLGQSSQERIAPFIEMLEASENPSATIIELSERNGHAAQLAGQGGGSVEEEPITVFHITERMRPILQPIVERYEEAQAEVERIREQFDAARTEASTLLNMLKAAGAVERKVYKPQKKMPQKQSKGSHVSEETALRILEQIKGYVASSPPALEDVPGSFTRPEIERGLGLHHSQVGAAVERLRDMGHIRAAGIVKLGNQKANVFAVVG